MLCFHCFLSFCLRYFLFKCKTVSHGQVYFSDLDWIAVVTLNANRATTKQRNELKCRHLSQQMLNDLKEQKTDV